MDETLETLTETMQECFENDQTTVGSMKSAFNPFPDPVYDELYHAVIFFIKPDKTNLSEKEVHWVKQIGQLAPVIPVISKADTLTGEELRRVKYQIRSLLKSVDLFDYAANDAECGYRVKDAIQSLSREWPFTIINPSSTPPSSASAHINFRNSETTSENSDTFKKDASDLFNRHKNNLKCSSDPRNTGLMDALKPATDNSSERKTRQTPWGNLFVRDHSDWDKLENFLFR